MRWKAIRTALQVLFAAGASPNRVCWSLSQYRLGDEWSSKPLQSFASLPLLDGHSFCPLRCFVHGVLRNRNRSIY